LAGEEWSQRPLLNLSHRRWKYRRIPNHLESAGEFLIKIGLDILDKIRASSVLFDSAAMRRAFGHGALSACPAHDSSEHSVSLKTASHAELGHQICTAIKLGVYAYREGRAKLFDLKTQRVIEKPAARQA